MEEVRGRKFLPASRNEAPPPCPIVDSRAEQKNFLRGRPLSSAVGGGAERVDFFRNF